MQQQRIETIEVKECLRTCSNCEHYMHLVGLGLGGRCGHPTNQFYGDASLKLMMIPSREHSCEYHELTE